MTLADHFDQCLGDDFNWSYSAWLHFPVHRASRPTLGYLAPPAYSDPSKTTLRALARRHLARDPPSFKIRETHEIAWLALGVSMMGAGLNTAKESSELWEAYSKLNIRWEVATSKLLHPEVPATGCHLKLSEP
jgi:hypothetical protein